MQFLYNNIIYDSLHSTKVAVSRTRDLFSILYKTKCGHWFQYKSEYIARDYVISEFEALTDRQALMWLAKRGRIEKIQFYFPECVYEQ